MNYPYSSSPYIQTAMAQAIQAVMTGHPLPPNCFVMTIPIQQAQQMFPQMMVNQGSANAPVGFSQQAPYYGQQFPPQLGPYQQPQQQYPNAPGPYLNHHSQGQTPNTNYPVVPYSDQSKSKGRHGKKDRSGPHPNIYNSSSFDSDMKDLSWSRLFGHHQTKPTSNQDSTAADPKTKAIPANKRANHSAGSYSSSSSSGTLSSTETDSSSTASDESIRRVNVVNKQSAGSSSSKQQTKGTLPFKYSSEFIPGNGNTQPQRDPKIKPDDVFVVRKPQPPAS